MVSCQRDVPKSGEFNGSARAHGGQTVSQHHKLVGLGLGIFPRGQQTPETLGALVKGDAEKWWPIIKELGIKAE
jgi:hypothetical protein